MPQRKVSYKKGFSAVATYPTAFRSWTYLPRERHSMGVSSMVKPVLELVSRITGKINWDNFGFLDLQTLMKDRINHLGPLAEKLLHCELQLARAVPDTDIIVRCLPREVVKFIEASERNRELLELLASGGHEVKKIAELLIDRSKHFDPVAFIGEGWRVEEEDERSLALFEVDLATARFETVERYEYFINGETILDRLKKAGYIRLDAKFFQTLWENQHRIPERWKEKTNGQVTLIFFDGTILRNSSDDRCVLCLYWFGNDWRWTFRTLASVREYRQQSVVLEQLAA